ncbi:hypothetical protein [Cohnella silvisoli]|uniref:Alpha-L-rhamnosidase six-hairpin glycosidase domain-containing protein n=1 Tax=Cohnella silvisoli TaxID=2873699 RepID=A0ABV1KW63_9BACL|nr:hypothetical protein [Cohnella silvisoli]MCD9023738.1 hypothetical protein [Cohnella silvisoli]
MTVHQAGGRISWLKKWIALAEQTAVWQLDAPKEDVFMLGNGRVSAVLGWGNPINELGWVLGPYYESGHNRGEHTTSYFGTLGMAVKADGKKTVWETQWAGRVRGTAVFLTEVKSASGLIWRTVDFAEWHRNTLVRIHLFSNEGERPIGALDVSANWRRPDEIHRPWDPAKEQWTGPENRYIAEQLRIFDHQGVERTMTWVLHGEHGVIEKECLGVSLHGLLAGDERMFVQTISAGSDTGIRLAEQLASAADPLQSLEEVLLGWKKWGSEGAAMSTSEPWLDDLLDSTKVWCKVQQSAHGVISPMIFYSDAYIRDCCGPVRLFLRLGMKEEVTRIFDFYRNAALFHQRFKETYYSGLNNIRQDVDRFEGDEDVRWEQIDPGKAEIPSWLVLWHYWYWLQTGDSRYAIRDWALLLRCLESQTVDINGWIRFHGDETYAYLSSLSEEYKGFFHQERSGSLEATVLYVYAVEAMEELARSTNSETDIGNYSALKDQVLENLDKNFLGDDGYQMASAEHRPLQGAHSLVLTTSHWIEAFSANHSLLSKGSRSFDMWKSAFVQAETTDWHFTAPYAEGINGHLPGYMLAAAKQNDCRELEPLLARLKNMATKAGAYAEVYKSAEQSTARGYHGLAWGRLRPWESGVNADAMIYALFGIRNWYVDGLAELEVAPYLPSGWNHAKITGFRTGERILSLEIVRTADQVIARLTNEGEKELSLRIYLKRTNNSRLVAPGECTEWCCGD